MYISTCKSKQWSDLTGSLHRKSTHNVVISSMPTKQERPLSSENDLCISCCWPPQCEKRQRNDSPAEEQNGIILGHVVTGKTASLLGPCFFPPNENTTCQVYFPVVQTSCLWSLGLKHMRIFRFCWLICKYVLQKPTCWHKQDHHVSDEYNLLHKRKYASGWLNTWVLNGEFCKQI